MADRFRMIHALGLLFGGLMVFVGADDILEILADGNYQPRQLGAPMVLIVFGGVIIWYVMVTLPVGFHVHTDSGVERGI